METVSSLPHDDDAERAVLGAILLGGSIPPRIAALLSRSDFYRPAHCSLFGAMQALTGKGQLIEPLAVSAELGHDRDRIGGFAYIASLMTGIPKSTNVEYYASVLRELAQRRCKIKAALTFADKAMNGATPEDLHGYESDLREVLIPDPGAPCPVDLHSAAVTPKRPEFTVSNLIRRSGLHLFWAQPGGLKTHTFLHLTHALMLEERPPVLFGHPDLTINRGYKRVLWIATEEDAGTLRCKADMVLRGLGVRSLGGVLLHLFAADSRRRITLDDLPALLETEGPFDAVVLDSLTGLRPKLVNGQRVKWDVDNDAANEQCLLLRGLAEKHSVAFLIVHHTGRDTTKGYRGPTDWWASADVQLGLVPDEGRVRVQVEKNRDGAVLKPFLLAPSWGPEGFYLEYQGGASSAKLTGNAQRADDYLNTHGDATQEEIRQAIGVARSTMQDIVRRCVEAGQWKPTGEARGRSPIYARLETTK